MSLYNFIMLSVFIYIYICTLYWKRKNIKIVHTVKYRIWKSPMFFLPLLKKLLFWETSFSKSFCPLLPDSNVSIDISIHHLKFIKKQTQIKIILGIYYEKQYSEGIRRFSLVAEKQNTPTFKTEDFFANSTEIIPSLTKAFCRKTLVSF